LTVLPADSKCSLLFPLTSWAHRWIDITHVSREHDTIVPCRLIRMSGSPAYHKSSWQSFTLFLDAKHGTHITPISPLLITPGHRESNDADGGNGQYSDGLISSTSGYGKNATTVRFSTVGVIRYSIYLQVQYVVSPLLRVQVRGYGGVRSSSGTRT
jgi:hypothetical protein